MPALSGSRPVIARKASAGRGRRRAGRRRRWRAPGRGAAPPPCRPARSRREVRRPEHADPGSRREPADDAHHLAAGLARRARPSPRRAAAGRGRCSSARAISARRCWPPESLATRLRSRSATPTCAATSAARVRASARGQAVQRGMIGEVLRHRQVGVERPALEDDAHLRQRRARARGAGRGRRRRSARRRCRRAG